MATQYVAKLEEEEPKLKMLIHELGSDNDEYIISFYLSSSEPMTELNELNGFAVVVKRIK